jgi:hypothetical protein
MLAEQTRLWAQESWQLQGGSYTPLDCWDGLKQESYRNGSDSGSVERRLICTACRSLKPTETRDSTITRKLLGVSVSLKKFKKFLMDKRFLARTDHRPLDGLFKKAIPQSRTTIYVTWLLVWPNIPCTWRMKLFSWLALLLPRLWNVCMWRVFWRVFQKQMEMILYWTLFTHWTILDRLECLLVQSRLDSNGLFISEDVRDFFKTMDVPLLRTISGRR